MDAKIVGNVTLGEANGTRTPQRRESASPWYRRPGILLAAAASVAGFGIVVSGPGEPDTAPGGTIAMSTPWATSFSLIATDFWEPPPPPPPPVAAPPPPQAEAPAPAPRSAPRQEYVPPPPPPPPPPQLVLRFDNPLTAAFVSIVNNPTQGPVGCLYRSVAVAGIATSIGFSKDHPFTVTGSGETSIPQGSSEGPATGSTFHVTVTCDNGLSTSQDAVY